MNLMKYKHLIINSDYDIIIYYKMVFLGEIITTNDEYERHPINEWRDNYFIENDDSPLWFIKHIFRDAFLWGIHF